MAQQHINLGTPNNNDGDYVRDAFVKAEANFTELYGLIGNVGNGGSGTLQQTLDAGNAAVGLEATILLDNPTVGQIITTRKQSDTGVYSGLGNINGGGAIFFGINTYGTTKTAFIGSDNLKNGNYEFQLPDPGTGQINYFATWVNSIRATSNGNINLTAVDIPTSNLNFNNNLSNLDSNIQVALDTIDNLKLKPTLTANTGTVIDLSNPMGNYCNMLSASSVTNFTSANSVLGGKAKILTYQALTQPEILGGRFRGARGNNWAYETNMYIIVEYMGPGRGVDYYFENV